MSICSVLRICAVSAFGLALSGLGATIPAAMAEVAGNAVQVNQSARLSGPSGRQTIQVGTGVVMGDRVKTNRGGLVELIFSDETKLLVGPNSSLVIESYLLRSDAKANSFAVRALGGSFRFITGKSEKKAYTIKTPTATIGVRGTSFDLAVLRSGETDMVLFSGAAQLCSQAGCVIVEQACGLARASRGEAARLIRDPIYKSRRIVDRFPYIVSQEELSPQFRVASTGCGDVMEAVLVPPKTTGAIRGPFTANDDDPDFSRPERERPSRERPDPPDPEEPGDNGNGFPF